MTLSPREKTIGLVVLASAGLFVLDRVLLSPMFDRLDAADAAIEHDSRTLLQSNATMQNGGAASRRWTELSAKHIGADASAAQSALLNHVSAAARDAGLAVTSLRNERGEKTMGYARTGLRASGTATMATLAAFLQRLQSADLPVRVTDLQIKSNKPGVDDLTVDLGISTIYKAAEETR